MLEKLMAAQERIAELEADNARLKTVMVAAAEEIHEHWDAHCDAEGYGPANLMRRLEEGISSEYGYTAGRFAELQADNARLRVDGWFPANLANVPTGDMRRKVLSYWSSGTVEGKYTAEELAYHIAAHAKHGDHFVVAKAWAEYPTAAIDAAKESA